MKMKDILGFEVNEISKQNLDQLVQKKKELLTKLKETQEELLKRRIEARMGTLKNTASIRNTRKDIARILTALSLLDREIKAKKEIKKW